MKPSYTAIHTCNDIVELCQLEEQSDFTLSHTFLAPLIDDMFSPQRMLVIIMYERYSTLYTGDSDRARVAGDFHASLNGKPVCKWCHFVISSQTESGQNVTNKMQPVSHGLHLLHIASRHKKWPGLSQKGSPP